MHAHIDDDIKNDECKIMFTHELQKGTEKLVENIKKRFEKDEQQFREDLQEDIEQFEERIKDSLIMLDRTNIDSGFDFSFNIDSGINKIGLFASIGGLALLLMKPVVGGIALIGGLVLGAIGIFKSVWSFFDSDYKKSQQKKEVGKNLDKFCEKIEEQMINQLKSYKKIIFEEVESIKVGFNDPVVCYERIREGLIKAREGLRQIPNNIKTRIAQ